MSVDEETARGGYLNCLKYLHEIEFRWSARVCDFAAEKGHLDCLKYLNQIGYAYILENTKSPSKTTYFSY